MYTHSPGQTGCLLQYCFQILLTGQRETPEVGVVTVGVVKVSSLNATVKHDLQAPDVQPLITEAADRRQTVNPGFSSSGVAPKSNRHIRLALRDRSWGNTAW